MAFFKFSKGGDEHLAPASATESVAALRKRARHRLMGAAILVLVGVVGFPLLFDSQPRPIAVDIPIEIPDKTKVKPLPPLLPAAPATPTASAASAAPQEKQVDKSPEKPPEKSLEKPPGKPADPAAAKAAKASEKPTPKPAAKPTDRPTKTPADQPADKAAPKPAHAPNDAAKAQALLEGVEAAQPAHAPASGAARYIVQVGAFAEVAKARELRLKIEKAGVKTYTQVVQTAQGARIRVRVGPFDSRSQADTAATKIKALDLPAVILEL